MASRGRASRQQGSNSAGAGRQVGKLFSLRPVEATRLKLKALLSAHLQRFTRTHTKAFCAALICVAMQTLQPAFSCS